ncbi:hypothetical protein HYQ44_017361 [Verticillium longisporum]|nr:hypothetical protein HYQ44_017361 [Verticillium longisporum]
MVTVISMSRYLICGLPRLNLAVRMPRRSLASYMPQPRVPFVSTFEKTAASWPARQVPSPQASVVMALSVYSMLVSLSQASDVPIATLHNDMPDIE